ncbi:23S rRNA (adenine(2503)-C(2))-methyltransferase RlmN [Aliamphritea ceti]|uniref:23S rRNA (adenine(2503)-C(2))-methyltransferase RlmN n=1 Tax=Aliamphritea ceti TaxID=1524258 RepID=UPI0021C29EC4|nr:23S rRNA (adenine(2503)-C(2))-methyltransferase RlmN [Aliamphritea ceti]
MTEATEKVNLLGHSPQKLAEYFHSIGEKPFRATQVLKWIHQFGVSDFAEMTNISKALREKLSAVAEIREPEVLVQNISKDGTRKWVIKLEGGSCVEAVLIPENGRATLCVSSQIGCSLDCSFCSTGKQGFNRNMSAAEIIGQVRVAIRSFGPFDPSGDRRVTNVVFMGMGEPLMNFENVVDAIHLMMDDNAYGLSKRRVTLSTSGVVPALDKLREVTDVSLAISLHAGNNALRDELVPINKKYPIDELVAACNRYMDSLNDKRVVTVEYTLIEGVNDQPLHARELVKVLKRLPCKLNLIPFNPFPNSDYMRPSEDAIQAFKMIVVKAGIITTVRRTRGDDVDAACGQLVGQVMDRTRRSEKYIPLTPADAVQVQQPVKH